MLSFNILGAMEIVCCERVCVPTAPKVRNVLALLLVRANQLVDTDSIIRELWGEKPPRSAVTTTQTYICHLRKKFEQENDSGERGVSLDTVPPGYVLRVPRGHLDADRFAELTARGRSLLEEGRVAEAARLLRDALALWRGPALANVSVGALLSGHVAHLEETRIRALEMRIQADLALGRDRELIPELRALVATYPFNEWFHAQLIDALRRAGRRGEALQAYQHVRNVLNEELGLEPSADLQRLHRAVLTGDAHRDRPPYLSPVALDPAV
jgi:SARP family transcriptional regulator, regulator of embCAB operon